MLWFDDLRWRSARWGPLLHDIVRQAVAFDVSAIRAYVDEHVRPGASPKTEDDFRGDLPNCAPFAPAMYMEWAEPAQPAGRLALAIGAWHHEDEQGGPRAGWGLACFTIARNIELRAFAYPLLCIVADVEGDGHLSALRLGRLNEARDDIVPLLRGDMDNDRFGHVFGLCDAATYVGLTAICFGHCKGVALVDHQPPRQQRRAAERAGRPPLVSYRTVDIAPVTRILRDEGQIERTGIKKALHITRGHFAHYTEDAPLFGKYTGTFYRPMHVRGRPQEGVVLKDYRVLGPAEDRD